MVSFPAPVTSLFQDPGYLNDDVKALIQDKNWRACREHGTPILIWTNVSAVDTYPFLELEYWKSSKMNMYEDNKCGMPPYNKVNNSDMQGIYFLIE